MRSFGNVKFLSLPAKPGSPCNYPGHHDNFLSTEHLLLGLMDDPTCPAARFLDTLPGLSTDLVRAALTPHLEQGPGHNEALGMQLTPRCKLVVDIAREEAGRKKIGSGHLLLGLIAEGEGLAGTVLARLGVKLDAARAVLR